MEEKAGISNARHEPARPSVDMLLIHLENNALGASRSSDAAAQARTELTVAPQGAIKKPGTSRLVCGGMIFIGLTLGIFWYQFSRIPAGSRPEIWNQLQWHYLIWLLLFLPVDTFAAGLRIWVIGRVLQPGVSLWTCLKAEWANLGLAMLTPSQTGGGFGQMYLLCCGGMSLGTALTVSLISFMGSMVVLLLVGIHSVLTSKAGHLTVLVQGAFFVFFLVFGAMLVALCRPSSVRRVAGAISRVMGNIEKRYPSQGNHGSSKKIPVKRIPAYINTLLKKLIDLCYLHQDNVRRFFRLNPTAFLWVCLLSLVFIFARAVMAFLCLRFLGIQAAGPGDVVATQLGLIFLIYFAPTPGSSGLAEGASMLMMAGVISSGLAPYYNLLWRCTTLYLPAVAGLLFLIHAAGRDARRLTNR